MLCSKSPFSFKLFLKSPEVVSCVVEVALPLMMEAEEISVTLVFNSTLTELIAPEGVSTFIHHESCKSYIFWDL
jgi:hypothetical protein